MNNRRYAIPRKENELIGSPPSPVTVSQLTPEELEEIRRKYPATKRDRTFKKPIEIKTKPREENNMPRGRKPKNPDTAVLLREKNVSTPADPKTELLDKAEKEIERLTAEVEQLREQKDDLELSRDDYKKMFEGSYERVTTANAKIGEHLQTIKEQEKLIESLEEERDRLIEKLDIPEPNSETNLLESAIQDLTRARWILGRLTASGE